ncbi:hypothetical protein NHL50_12230 [Acidimicrobiia bacterium EGI L10123]|uniref:hypothetical protein n=1 Tax=Salinilacustrithrix flava TaxID=2957203 RepID=UPI003D7C2EDF|nr:hypothetical protein [Acidimicrobiia bacterium EGI L10123]
MPDNAERGCALHILVPSDSESSPDASNLLAALGSRLCQVHVLGWALSAEPDAACVRRAATVAAEVEAATGTWPSYTELIGSDVIVAAHPDIDDLVTISVGSHRSLRAAARRVSVRSGAHLALVPARALTDREVSSDVG